MHHNGRGDRPVGGRLEVTIFAVVLACAGPRPSPGAGEEGLEGPLATSARGRGRGGAVRPEPSEEGEPPARSLGAPGEHRLAAVQYEIRAKRDLKTILEEAVETATSAAAAGAELVMFPELFILDVWPEEVEDEPAFVRSVARERSPRFLETLAKAAEMHGVAILAGSVPELRDGGLYNSAHLFFPDGRRVRQDKMYLTEWGRRMGMRPGEDLVVFDAPWGRSVILVCYDVEFPGLSAELVSAQPEVILVPSMTESPHGFSRVRWAAQARAVEHHAYVVLAGSVGSPSPSWVHFGQAAFITPRDEGFPGILIEGPLNSPAIVLGDLDLAALRRSRSQATFYPAKDELERRRRSGRASAHPEPDRSRQGAPSHPAEEGP